MFACWFGHGLVLLSCSGEIYLVILSNLSQPKSMLKLKHELACLPIFVFMCFKGGTLLHFLFINLHNQQDE